MISQQEHISHQYCYCSQYLANNIHTYTNFRKEPTAKTRKIKPGGPKTNNPLTDKTPDLEDPSYQQRFPFFSTRKSLNWKLVSSSAEAERMIQSPSITQHQTRLLQSERPRRRRLMPPTRTVAANLYARYHHMNNNIVAQSIIPTQLRNKFSAKKMRVKNAHDCFQTGIMAFYLKNA